MCKSTVGTSTFNCQCDKDKAPVDSLVMPSSDEAKKRLLAAIPYFRNAVNKAKSEGKMMLGIMSFNPDGSGKILGQFEADSFFDDIAAVIDAPPQTAEDDMTADVLSFLSKHGLRKA